MTISNVVFANRWFRSLPLDDEGTPSTTGDHILDCKTASSKEENSRLLIIFKSISTNLRSSLSLDEDTSKTCIINKVILNHTARASTDVNASQVSGQLAVRDQWVTLDSGDSDRASRVGVNFTIFDHDIRSVGDQNCELLVTDGGGELGNAEVDELDFVSFWS